MIERNIRSGPSMRVHTNSLSLKITWYPIQKSSAEMADAVPSMHFLGRKLNHRIQLSSQCIIWDSSHCMFYWWRKFPISQIPRRCSVSIPRKQWMVQSALIPCISVV